MDKFGLPERTVKELLAYFETKTNIDEVKIFGSRAKGNYHNGSDIDFAIWKNDEEAITRILGELDDLPTPYMFDVIDYKSLSNEKMKNSIDKDGVVFYKRV